MEFGLFHLRNAAGYGLNVAFYIISDAVVRFFLFYVCLGGHYLYKKIYL